MSSFNVVGIGRSTAIGWFLPLFVRSAWLSGELMQELDDDGMLVLSYCRRLPAGQRGRHGPFRFFSLLSILPFSGSVSPAL